MFSIKERATLAANIAGSMAATEQGWETSPKELVRIAEDILDEVMLVYKPKAMAEEERFFAETRRKSSLNPFVI